MTEFVLDASALIALLLGERGFEKVADALPGSLISAVNLSEVVVRLLEMNTPLEKIEFELRRLPIDVIPFDATHAKLTASLKSPTRTVGLSLADRICVALGMDRGLPVMTGDRDWLKANLPIEVVIFR